MVSYHCGTNVDHVRTAKQRQDGSRCSASVTVVGFLLGWLLVMKRTQSITPTFCWLPLYVFITWYQVGSGLGELQFQHVFLCL